MAPPLLVQALRLPFLTGSLLPVIITAFWAVTSGPVLWSMALLTLLGVGALQTAANLINDFSDAKGSDPINNMPTPFSGGSRVIQQGRMQTRTVYCLSVFFFGLALACGVVLALWGRPWALVLGLFGFLSAVLYSVNPVSLMSRGLGELAIFLAFGPVLTLGAGYIFTGQFTAGAFWLGLPQAFLITAVIWINQFPDLPADRAAGKRNLVVRMGNRAARILYLLLVLGAFASLFFLVHVLSFTPWLYLALCALPLSLRAFKLVWQYYDQPLHLIPAQGLTIITHLAVGILMMIGLGVNLWL